MKKQFLYIALALAVTTGGCGRSGGEPVPTQEVSMDLSFSSPAFKAGEPIPQDYSCKGRNISPALEWGDPPGATQSLALIMDDPDAPMGTWVHWVIFNIPAETRGLAEAIPADGQLKDESLQGRNSGGGIGYAGPCPPSGTHRYFFKLYALDTRLSLKAGASKEDLLKAMDGHILGQTQLMGTFSK